MTNRAHADRYPAGGAGTTVMDRPRRSGTAERIFTYADQTVAQPVGRSSTLPGRERSHALRGRPQRFGRKPGSKQVLSVRGRRVRVEKADPKLIKFVVFIVVIMVAAVIGTLILSARTTSQSFELQQLQSQESDLNNQLETANRDLENKRSVAELARQASSMGMVVPDQPGVLQRMPDGSVQEVRPADPSKTRPIIDVNGKMVRPQGASSDPGATGAIAGNVQPLPSLDTDAASRPVPGTAPYAARRTTN